jgi:L-ribulose-5-phosphate 3-epimerase
VNQLHFGYNTNGFAHHQFADALQIIAELGYQSAAITLDHYALNPFDRSELRRQIPVVRQLLSPLRQGAVIETGTRFLLDPHRKHWPTLIFCLQDQREERLDFLFRAIDIAAELEIPVVSFWSGAADANEIPENLWRRLVDGCHVLCRHAASKGIRLAFEPEPGMFIDTMPKFEELFTRVNHPAFGLTLDIGHLHCMGETPIEDHLRRWKHVLWNVHIEDMRRDVHEHLMFGEGEIDFPPILRTLREIGYTGGVHVELSRHSHDAVETARKALAFLRKAVIDPTNPSKN